MRREKVRREAHATRKKKFLAKALVTERRSNELRVFSLLLLLYEGIVPLLSELSLCCLWISIQINQSFGLIDSGFGMNIEE